MKALRALPALMTALLLPLLLPSSAARAAEASDDSLSLSEAVRWVVESHPAVEQALQGVKAAEAQVGLSQSASSPLLSAGAGYTRLDPVAQMETPAGKEDLFPHNNLDLHLLLRKTLYDYGRTETAVDAARTGLVTARDNVEIARWNLAYQTAATFNLILILRENLALLDEQIGTLNQHLAISQKRCDTGSATKLDVLSTSVRVAQAQSARCDAANVLSNQEILLRHLLGWAADRPVKLRGRLALSRTRFDADSLIQAAMGARQELRIAQDAESSATFQARLAALGDKPTLGLGIVPGVKNGYFPDLDRLRINLAATLSVEVPLFDGQRTLRQMEQAQANLGAARARSSEMKRRISAEVEQAVAGVRASGEKIEDAQVQVMRAEEAVAMAKTQYAAGVITNLDLLDAETARSEAKLAVLRARYDYVSSLTMLDRVTGRRIW